MCLSCWHGLSIALPVALNLCFKCLNSMHGNMPLAEMYAAMDDALLNARVFTGRGLLRALIMMLLYEGCHQFQACCALLL